MQTLEKKRVFALLTKAAGEISSAKCQGPCPSQHVVYDAAFVPALLAAFAFPLYALFFYPILSFSNNCSAMRARVRECEKLFDYSLRIQLAGRVFS